MAAALDWQAQKALQCSGCGGYLDETTRLDREDRYDAELVACHRCAAGARVERQYQNNKGDMAGIRQRTWDLDDV